MIIQGGQLVGFLYAVPLILIAWIKGQRAGLLAAVVGIVFLMLIVLRNRLDSLWIVSAAETSLGFLVIGAAVGKLRESLRELSRTADARLLAEKTAREAEKRCRD